MQCSTFGVLTTTSCHNGPGDTPSGRGRGLACGRTKVPTSSPIDILSDRPAKQVQQLVHDAGNCPQACEVYRDIVKAGLVKILEMINPENGSKWRPKDSQIDVVNALIFGRSDILFAARTGEGKSLIFQC